MLCKKIIFCVLLSLLVLFVSLITIDNGDFIYTSAQISDVKTVIIDAGHGGFDGGAVAPDGTVEKDINLKISNLISEMLKTAGYKVVLTREADVSTDDVETNSIAIKKPSTQKIISSVRHFIWNALNIITHSPNTWRTANKIETPKTIISNIAK